MGVEVIFLNEVGNGFEIPSYWGSVFDCGNIYFGGSDRIRHCALRNRILALAHEAIAFYIVFLY